ncbi:MAG: hypothetical protein KC620_25920 [Myxococcales bacterium]|nr:hypothetical protein [Myxococcales bacterium]
MSRPLALLLLLVVAALVIGMALRDPQPRAVAPVSGGPDATARVEPPPTPVAVVDGAVALEVDAAAIERPIAAPPRMRTDGWRALPVEASERVVALELRSGFNTPVGRMALRCIPEF